VERQLEVLHGDWLQGKCGEAFECTEERLSERELRSVIWMYSRARGLKGIVERLLVVQ